jgi:hypothetical protein
MSGRRARRHLGAGYDRLNTLAHIGQMQAKGIAKEGKTIPKARVGL